MPHVGPQSKPAQGGVAGGAVGGVTRVTPVRTRMATRQQSSFYGEEDEDMAEIQPTFSGPIIK